MKLKINLTKTDIKMGMKRNARSCPIARAVQRVIKCEASVGQENLWIRKSYYPLPEFLSNWIKKFDNGENVKPFRKVFNL